MRKIRSMGRAALVAVMLAMIVAFVPSDQAQAITTPTTSVYNHKTLNYLPMTLAHVRPAYGWVPELHVYVQAKWQSYWTANGHAGRMDLYTIVLEPDGKVWTGPVEVSGRPWSSNHFNGLPISHHQCWGLWRGTGQAGGFKANLTPTFNHASSGGCAPRVYPGPHPDIERGYFAIEQITIDWGSGRIVFTTWPDRLI